MTDASRKAKERASRKAKGEVRVEAWLPKAVVSGMDKRVSSFRGDGAFGRSEAIEDALRDWLGE